MNVEPLMDVPQIDHICTPYKEKCIFNFIHIDIKSIHVWKDSPSFLLCIHTYLIFVSQGNLAFLFHSGL